MRINISQGFSFLQLLAVKLLPAVPVYDVAVAALDKPSKAIHSPTLFINIEALFGLEELRDGPTSTLIILELESAH